MSGIIKKVNTPCINENCKSCDRKTYFDKNIRRDAIVCLSCGTVDFDIEFFLTMSDIEKNIFKEKKEGIVCKKCSVVLRYLGEGEKVDLSKCFHCNVGIENICSHEFVDTILSRKGKTTKYIVCARCFKCHGDASYYELDLNFVDTGNFIETEQFIEASDVKNTEFE